MALLQLPRDILNEIFTYLNSRCDIWYIERVCKMFKTISRERAVWYPPTNDSPFDPVKMINYRCLTIFTGFIAHGTDKLYSSNLMKFKVGNCFVGIGGIGNMSDHIRAYSLHRAREEVKIYDIDQIRMIIRANVVEIPNARRYDFGLIRSIRMRMRNAIINMSITFEDLIGECKDTLSKQELYMSYFDLIGQLIDKLTVRIKSTDNRSKLLHDVLSLLTVEKIIIQSDDT